MTDKTYRTGRVIETFDTSEELDSDTHQPSVEQGVIDALVVEHTKSDSLEQSIEAPLKPRRSNLVRRVFSISLLVLIFTELALTIYASFSTSIVLGSLYSIVIGTGCLLAGRIVLKEYRLLRRLKRHQVNRASALRLLNSEQIGEAKVWLSHVNNMSPSAKFGAFEASLDDHHSDKEVMLLYEKMILSDKDEEAKQIINKFALESGLLVAVSPVALVDMIAVLWRGSKMIERLAELYGVPLGYMSRIRLYRSLVKQILFAGASELMTDFATTAMSAEVAGKLSMRAAQGVSVGVLTARIGYKAMEVTRPLPKLENKRNLLAETTKSLFKMVVTKGQ